MARPKRCRRISSTPGSKYFKPRGIPLSELVEVVLTVDEYEALRLADLEGRYQEEAADQMGISRPTFGRIIDSARKKVAEALVKGRALKIEGGAFEVASVKMFKCRDCQHAWELADGKDHGKICPCCKSGDICRMEKDKGSPRGCGEHGGRCVHGAVKQ